MTNRKVKENRKSLAANENGKAEIKRPELDGIEQPKQEKPAFDPFDPESLRLRGIESLGVKKVLTTVPCNKPNKHQFVRVHPDDCFRLETSIFEDKVQGESYLVSPEFPELLDELSSDLTPVCLFTAVTRYGDCFLWPVKLPGADGRSNHWHESALAAAEQATHRWVRVVANMPAGRYDVFEASGNLPDPVWPEKSLGELLRLCFKNRLIDSTDHAILKSLRGEV